MRRCLSPLNTLWNGEPSPQSLQYVLEHDATRLRFAVQFPAGASPHPQGRPGAFTAELWRWDVGELFIAGSTGRYIELNLSPTSAWWLQGFAAPRVEDASFSPWACEVRALAGHSVEWSASLPALEAYLGPAQQWCYNVTGILNTPHYAFLSLATLPGAVPDFHQPASFLPLTGTEVII